MNKFLVALAALGIVSLVGIKTVSQAHTNGSLEGAPSIALPQDTGFSIELPKEEPAVFQVPVTTIVSHHQAKKSGAVKTWTCGEMHTNLVGGMNRDCTWR